MITLAEQIAEVQRELALRKACYPAWVKQGTLDPGAATYQLKVLEAVLHTLELTDFAQRQLALFPIQTAYGPAPCPYCGRLGHGEPCAPCCGG